MNSTGSIQTRTPAVATNTTSPRLAYPASFELDRFTYAVQISAVQQEEAKMATANYDLVFDGEDDYIEIPDSADFSVATPMTRPDESNTGPPELPGFSATLSW